MKRIVAGLLVRAAFGLMATAATLAPPADAQEADESMWREVVADDTVEAYSSFLRQYPDSTFSGLALRRIVELQGECPADVPVSVQDECDPPVTATTGNILPDPLGGFEPAAGGLGLDAPYP